MIDLPIDAHLPAIVDHLRDTRAIVIVAEPGAGKTTRVPPAILAASLLPREHPNLVMLQPRRVAARASAMRIADEHNWTLGEEVGYHVRFDRKIGRNTRLRVVTEGILTRQLLGDPFIDDIGCVVLDEFHERNLHTDLAIAMLREVRQSVREDLMLVVMSATLEAEPVARFLDDCPIIRVPGRAFPVQVSHRANAGGRIVDCVTNAIEHEIGEGGDVLVFLPGADEIRRVGDSVENFAQRGNLRVLPLHGSLEAEQQMAALAPSRQRKVILATNIAETSLTIDGVTTVIDSGYARVAGYDPQRGLDRLELKRISKASATQRAGRAGRTAPGRCVRLWSAKEDAELADFELPEVRRVDLAGTVLALHAWGKPDPRQFGWYEPPEASILSSAERLLAMLGALDSETSGKMTDLGRRMLSLPVHPRLARLLLLAADAGMLDEGATLAALLAERDLAVVERAEDAPVRVPKTQGDSDLLIRMQMLERAEHAKFSRSLRDEGIDANVARQVARTRDQLLRIAGAAKPQAAHIASAHEDRETMRLKLLLHAYPDRVCRRRGNDALAGVMVGGGGVRMARESVVTRAEFFLALDARQDQRSISREALVRIASRIEADWLEKIFPQSIRQEQNVLFDGARGKIIGVSQTFYRDLLLREDRNAAVDPSRAGDALFQALRPRLRQLIEQNPPVSNLLARIDLLRRHMPREDWPVLDDAGFEPILRDACAGRRSVEDVMNAGLFDAIRARLVYPLDRLLDEHAPETIQVPTGNRIRLNYQRQDQGETIVPVLAVRLQEMFGLLDTPKIAGGRLPVLLHLLGPNYRPVQVTDDLRGFWARTYRQVRKDLRARYPKHAWPEDPTTAPPQAKGRSHK